MGNEYENPESSDRESKHHKSANDESSEDHEENIVQTMNGTIKEYSDGSLYFERDIVKLRE